MRFIVSAMGVPVTLPPPSIEDVRSRRSMPDSSSTSGPFEPSPGYGPAVSVGSSTLSDAPSLAVALVVAAAVELGADPPPGKDGLNVEGQALVLDVVVGAGQRPALIHT